MKELDELLKDIEQLRDTLHKLIDKNGINIEDLDIISSSQALNEAITKYNELIRKKL